MFRELQGFSFKDYSLCSDLMVLSWVLSGFCTLMLGLALSWKLEGPYLWSSLSVLQSPLWNSALWTQDAMACLGPQALPRFPISKLLSGSSLHAMSLGNHRPHLICFPSLENHCSLLPGVQYLKSVVLCILSVFSVLSDGRLNPVPVTPPWPEVEVQLSLGTICSYLNSGLLHVSALLCQFDMFFPSTLSAWQDWVQALSPPKPAQHPSHVSIPAPCSLALYIPQCGAWFPSLNSKACVQRS